MAIKYNIYGYNYKLKLQELIEKISKQYSDKSKEKEFTKCREAVEKIYEIKNSV